MTAGLRILALTGKRPNGRVHGENWSWEDSFHGTPTEQELPAFESCFGEEQGTTGIAILIPPGLQVADVDTDRAGALLKGMGWEPTDESVIAQTKNGLHVWFVYPGADRNRWLGDGQQPDPGRTLLFKGLGGYVVAPPSLHFAADGSVDGTYEWVFPLVVGGVLQMPDLMPASAVESFKASDQWAAMKPDKTQMTSFSVTPVDGLQWWEWPKVWDYQMAGLERAIIAAADGNQNNVIHWAAMTARDEGVPSDVAMERLLAAAVQGGHPRARARDTIRGAYKRAPRV